MEIKASHQQIEEDLIDMIADEFLSLPVERQKIAIKFFIREFDIDRAFAKARRRPRKRKWFELW